MTTILNYPSFLKEDRKKVNTDCGPLFRSEVTPHMVNSHTVCTFLLALFLEADAPQVPQMRIIIIIYLKLLVSFHLNVFT